MLPPVRRRARRDAGGPGRGAVVHGPSAAHGPWSSGSASCVCCHTEEAGGRYTRMPPLDKRVIAKPPAGNPHVTGGGPCAAPVTAAGNPAFTPGDDRRRCPGGWAARSGAPGELGAG